MIFFHFILVINFKYIPFLARKVYWLPVSEQLNKPKYHKHSMQLKCCADEQEIESLYANRLFFF